MKTREIVITGLACCLVTLAVSSRSGTTEAGPFDDPNNACKSCNVLIPNLKDFGFYPTKWRRWPGYRAVKPSPGRGARAETVPTPIMEPVPADMFGLPTSPGPDVTPPTEPFQGDPLQPLVPDSPSDTVPGQFPDTDIDFLDPTDNSDLPPLNDDNSLSLPTDVDIPSWEEMPEPQTNRLRTDPYRRVPGVRQWTQPGKLHVYGRSPLRTRNRLQSAGSGTTSKVIRAGLIADSPHRPSRSERFGTAGRGVVPAAIWSIDSKPGQSYRGNPLRSGKSTTVSASESPIKTSGRNPLRPHEG